MSKVSIPKGTRDFGPTEMTRRNYLFQVIRELYELYGYAPIETPAMETMETLMGKYGEEGDRLIFKILNSGDFLKKATADELLNRDLVPLTSKLSEKALRYDLTVPFARFVVQHHHELAFPFKRYQIQPVWRADRPQKGRYREFYQCDADVIGSPSLLNELELIRIIQGVFTKLGLADVEIKLNNRKVLAGLAESLGASDFLIDLTTAMDKLDKIGLDKVNEELVNRGLPTTAIEGLQPLLTFSGSRSEKLNLLDTMLADSEIGKAGVEELNYLFQLTDQFGLSQVSLDLTLARGLNYYTGAIIEVAHPDFPSSICGGGRYDDLTGVFGMKGLSGVGISFGADRIYDLLLAKGLFPDSIETVTQVLFINFSDEAIPTYLKLAEEMRVNGISAEVYPDQAKLKKQMKYANDKKISHVVLIGEEEIQAGKATLKQMKTGNQEVVLQSNLIDQIK